MNDLDIYKLIDEGQKLIIKELKEENRNLRCQYVAATVMKRYYEKEIEAGKAMDIAGRVADRRRKWES